MHYPSRPCEPWLTAEEARDCCASAEGMSDFQVEAAVMAATEFLFERSMRQFRGACPATVRPCVRRCRETDVCGCQPAPAVDLGVWPVVSIVSVTVDGAEVPSGNYAVSGNRYLVRLPADGATVGWPTCQNAGLPATEPGTFEVQLTYGVQPPQLGLLAVRELTCDFLKGCGGGDCVVPARTRSISRQGVSVTMADPASVPKEKTGLPYVDAFLAAYNPKGRDSAALVWSPDTKPASRRR